MKIDLDLLGRFRPTDPFAVPPIDIERFAASIGDAARDHGRSDPDIARVAGTGACRVLVARPTPRLLQRLAILRWLPLDPASDGVWYVDEPVELDVGDNHLVSGHVARSYAEAMNLLFASENGMFSGEVGLFSPGADATAADLRAHVDLLAERCFVSLAASGRRVPITWLVTGLQQAVARANAPRLRAGLPLLSVPSRTMLGRRAADFRDRHRHRPGSAAEWRSQGGLPSRLGRGT